MNGAFDFGWLETGFYALVQGAALTIMLTVASTALGLFISVLGAAARRGQTVWLRSLVGFYVEAIRNTPFIVQLFIIYFGLPSFGFNISPIAAGILAMTLNIGAYATEIVAAGLAAIGPGQREAAQALGLRPRIVFFKVVLPQAMAVIFPALASQVVITMLDSAVVSQISVRELTMHANLIQSRTFRPFETFLTAAIIYLVLAIVLRRFLKLCAKRYLGAGLS
ncbi:amino acid ABC transporter permease (plasmid) [Agrobacterium tumefaciens]|uniref:Amino acid ABC transporter permease n=1 Tax=Agrobacterium tumefaciens TaxID=358 RepID=A0AAP9J927_AGRTU|nr:amino acid ABC transporter permease [Agrobacterium tumefaciens]NSZ61195.1 amino acid ABC transporter permease [Agrobacterium tumefaciens]NTZ64169.1 amino acid ABC transporter permease [Agrobacterium tumefaciens]QDY97604.1 amino acid ABC transporter permease [Agrobacterium tumefaciens]UXS12730.1 amino acid ABC transporter permease [Agrobacterium tumefaciens]UXS20092.1 amino acid ABC transporter permease [Agrobacterium tumefaciens]